jgi:hypothetical protein
MTRPVRWIALAVLLGFGIALAEAVRADDWTRPVEVTYDLKRCISFRARLSGPFLVVEATPDSGWHTFAMDNTRRAAEKLEGRKPLSLDLPTEISVTRGLEPDGPWFQSPPKDFSRPELRWYSWGFEDRALFVVKVRRSGAGPARIAVRGQVCTESICRKIDVAILIPLTATGAKPGIADIELKALVQVR